MDDNQGKFPFELIFTNIIFVLHASSHLFCTLFTASLHLITIYWSIERLAVVINYRAMQTQRSRQHTGVEKCELGQWECEVSGTTSSDNGCRTRGVGLLVSLEIIAMHGQIT
jgi:hypothetical protein